MNFFSLKKLQRVYYCRRSHLNKFIKKVVTENKKVYWLHKWIVFLCNFSSLAYTKKYKCCMKFKFQGGKINQKKLNKKIKVLNFEKNGKI